MGELQRQFPTDKIHEALRRLIDRRYILPASRAPAADLVVDAAGRAVLPGFADSHAHLVFAG